MFVGVIDISVSELFKGNYHQLQIFFLSRLPRLLAIILTGIGMSVAGLIMQQLTMNKFVSPSTGATIASAQFGILIAMLVLPNATLWHKTISAFITSIAGTYVFILFMQRIRYKNIIMVPLVGIMFGNIVAGFTEYLAYKHNLIQALTSWMVGDFSLILRGRYEIVFITLPLIIVAFFFADHFNIVGMGEDFSINLGVNYNILLFFGLSIAALITASVVVTVGTIPYLGLIIPNIVAIYKGDRLKTNLFDTAIFGADFVLICDILGRLINFPYEIPINLTVGVIGSIVFVYILVNRLKSPNKKQPKVETKINPTCERKC